MKILCVIPSRMGSTRLIRKPLAMIQGKPMIQWVYEGASQCQLLTKLVVATDDQEIVDVVQAAGGEAVMTDPALPTGSDRVAAVARLYPEMDIIVNLQGDQPFIQTHMIEQLVAPYLAGETPVMTTLACPIDLSVEHNDPGVVKVITDQTGHAIYFSRAPIPYFRQNTSAPVYHHLGVYAYQRDFLLKFTELAQTPLEQAEILEQLRAIEHGYQIRVCQTDHSILEINTPEELEQAQMIIWPV